MTENTPKEKFRLFTTKPANTGLILIPGGDTHQAPIQGIRHTHDKKDYVAHTGRRYWINKPIKRGYLTIWPEDNPEPLGNEPSKGLTATEIAFLYGPILAHALEGGFKGATHVPKWAKIALIGLGVALVVGFVGYFMWQKLKTGQNPVQT